MNDEKCYVGDKEVMAATLAMYSSLVYVVESREN